MKNLENKIQILNENRNEESLFDYVTGQSESDPNFFRWLFDEEFDNDFNSSLTEEQQAEFDAWVLELKKQAILEKWIVVKMEYVEDETGIRVTRRSNFEEMNACEAYADYGQQVDCNNAGCYSLSNTESCAKSDLITAFYTAFEIEETEENTEELNEFFPIDRAYPGTPDFVSEISLDAIITFEEKWIEENENHNVITAWTFWNGSNHETVTLLSDFGNTDCSEMDKDDQIAILLEMPESTPYIERTEVSEESENYIFKFDRWSNNPWYCYVERK